VLRLLDPVRSRRGMFRGRIDGGGLQLGPLDGLGVGGRRRLGNGCHHSAGGDETTPGGPERRCAYPDSMGAAEDLRGHACKRDGKGGMVEVKKADAAKKDGP